MQKFSTSGKIFLLGSLYMSQFIPLGFFTEAFPVYLRSLGFSLEIIGTIHLLLLPFMIKFLWAPLIDKTSSGKPGNYRKWIIIMQLFVSGCLFSLSFLAIDSGLTLILILTGFLTFFSATQDIATDATAVNILKKDEQGIGNGVQNAGHYLGSMLGGGVMLIVLNYFGWSATFISITFISLIPLVFLFLYKKNLNASVSQSTVNKKKVSPIEFFKRKGNMKWALFLLLLPLGISMADFIFKPFLIDAGMDLDEIGFLRGIIGLPAAFLGAIAGGFIIKKSGRIEFIIKLGLIQSAMLLLFLLPAAFSLEIWQIGAIIVVTRFISGIFFTVLYTLIMERSEHESAGTDFSLQIAILTFSSHGIASPIGGVVASATGYFSFFLICSAVSFITIMVMMFYFRNSSDIFIVNDIESSRRIVYDPEAL